MNPVHGTHIITRVPPASFTISKQQARRFLLAYHGLLPPRKLEGKSGVMDYLARVGCIQFDPINVVGGNADLVLQSRIANYKPSLLQELLYQDRSLVDGWDKVQSIYLLADWPYFERHRQRMRNHYGPQVKTGGRLEVAALVRQALKDRGPLSSLDIDHDGRLDWDWGYESRVVRASLDVMYAMGDVGIHHRVHTRRVFDLIENLLPKKLLKRRDPNRADQDYADWHVWRRIGGMGLAHPGPGERWLGPAKVPGWTRKEAIARLVKRGKLARVRIHEIPNQDFYVRGVDLPTLESAIKTKRGKPGAAFIAPLDNMMWHRDLLEMLFDFYYRWEVYVPAHKRHYGFYVLPVLYGDRMVARVDPVFDRAGRALTLQNWWWQPGVDKRNEAMQAALRDCVKDFCKYLGAIGVKLGAPIQRDGTLKAIVKDL